MPFVPWWMPLERRPEVKGVTSKEIDWFIPHQANMRIMEEVAKSFGNPHG